MTLLLSVWETTLVAGEGTLQFEFLIYLTSYKVLEDTLTAPAGKNSHAHEIAIQDY